MLKRKDLTFEERSIYMPTWEKILIGIFVVLLPIIGSIDNISF